MKKFFRTAIALAAALCMLFGMMACAPNQGADTPHVGENGNWFIGEKDTGIKAEGTDGKNGKDGEDGQNGKDGENGKDGKSAFDIWKERYGEADSTEEDFLAWLRGEAASEEGRLQFARSHDGQSYTVVGIGTFEGVDVVIPSEYKGKPVTEIAMAAFESCGWIESIEIPSTVRKMGGRAFYQCHALEKVIISDLAAWCSIDFADFSANPLYCARHLYMKGSEAELTALEIPEEVAEIGAYAFYNCSGITSVTIGSGVISIGNAAFGGGCYKLIEVWNHSALPISAGSGEYGGIAQYAKHVYDRREKGYQTATEEGYLFYEEGEEHFLLGYVGSEKALTLPEKSPTGSDYAIYQYAFYGRRDLTGVTVGSGVTSIGYEAFSGCSGLTSVTIGSGVTALENGAFYQCYGLTTIVVPACMTSIGTGAFADCPVRTVYYEGTAEDRSGIEMGDHNDALTSAAVYYFSAETPTEEQWTEYANWWHYDPATSLPTPWTR